MTVGGCFIKKEGMCIYGGGFERAEERVGRVRTSMVCMIGGAAVAEMCFLCKHLI